MTAGVILGSVVTLGIGLVALSAIVRANLSIDAKREIEGAAFAIGVTLLILAVAIVLFELGVFVEGDPLNPMDPHVDR